MRRLSIQSFFFLFFLNLTSIPGPERSVGPNCFLFWVLGWGGETEGIFIYFPVPNVFPSSSKGVPEALKVFPMVFPIVAQFYPICISTSMYVDCKGPKGNMTMLLLGGGEGWRWWGASIRDCPMSKTNLWGANESGGFFRNETQRVHGHSVGGRRRLIWQWLFFGWSGDMDGRCFMCAIPCTLNLLEVRWEGGKIKYHLQNLQQFQSKFEVEKQGSWNEVKTRNIFHWFWN